MMRAREEGRSGARVREVGLCGVGKLEWDCGWDGFACRG